MNPNYETLRLKDFDLLGMIKLRDVEGIEGLVTPVGDGEFISRATPYWTSSSCADASQFRENLKSVLPYCQGKKAFVILEYMANLSGKVYYCELQKAINKGDASTIKQAKNCLYEDVSNIINLIEGEPIVPSRYTLPESEMMTPERSIECDNMGLLYLYTKCFEVPRGYHMLNTGLGGIFIGPFFKCIHNVNWTNMLKSKYVDEQSSENKEIMDLIVEPQMFDNGKVLLIDDNIGTGATTKEIVEMLREKGMKVKYGAVQYNWINYFKVGEGTKDIERFNPSEIDYVTQINYPGHKLIKHSIEILKGQRDLAKNVPSQDPVTPWGRIYELYKQEKHYNKGYICDLITLQNKGLKYCLSSGVNFNDGTGSKHNKSAFTTDTMKIAQRIDAFNQMIYDNSYIASGKGKQMY